MIKKLFGIFIPLCIFSFIAFGISAAILGTGYGSRYASDTVYELESATVVDYGIGGDVSSWDISESYSDIRLDIGACNVTIAPGQEGDNTTYFSANRVDGDMVDIYTEVSGDTLVVTVDNSFKFINFGIDFDRLFEAISTGEGFENIFGGSRLDIVVPPQVYDSLEVNMGSGSVEIVDINAASNNLYLGSGSLSFFNQNDFTSDSLEIDVGSGYIQAYGAKTREYSVDINSGRCEITGLSGDGDLTINSGNGVIGFDSFDGNCDVSMNSGGLDIYVPSNSSMRIDADVNSGSVYVNAADHVNSRLRSGDSVTIGGGDHEMYIYLNSGRISISEASAVNEATAVEIPPIDTVIIQDSTAGSAATTVAEAETELILEGGKFIAIPEAPQAPEAPTAPKAPRAPSFAAFTADYAQG
ncbi:MAG: DUF4097 domain-containing protein [Oscillospiraceae bacterium]|nr:DUF4097 domain-containing protein [Oscillospiraceae bacterium]